MNDLNLEDRLKRIEQLLVANKDVLTLKEACDYTCIPGVICISLPTPEKYLTLNQGESRFISTGSN